jgi:hypothetical protein
MFLLPSCSKSFARAKLVEQLQEHLFLGTMEVIDVKNDEENQETWNCIVSGIVSIMTY